MNKAYRWEDVKKELDIPEKELLLAKAKLDLSEFIYGLRRAKRISQKRLAELIGVSQPYIAKIEGGEENLTIETIAKILSALNLSLTLSTHKRRKKEDILHIAKAA